MSQKFNASHTRKIVAYCLVMAISVVGLFFSISNASAKPRTEVGVNFHCTWSGPHYTDNTQRKKALDTLKTGNMQWVRIDVGWRTLETAGKGTATKQGKWYLDRTTYCVNEAKARGFKVLLTLSWSPDWSHPGKSGGNHYPDNLQNYADFAGWIAGYYKGKVDGWEIWNEPNLSSFASEYSPAKYTDMMRRAYPKIKAADPNTKVVGAVVSSNDTGWINAMYNAGAKGYFDVMAVHPYPSPADERPERPYTEVSASQQRYRFTYLKGVADLMASKGDANKPIWITEVGWSSHNNSGNEASWKRGVGADGKVQADYAVRAVKYIDANVPQVKVMIWYNEKNRTGVDAHQANYGLLNSDLSPKPIYYSLQNLLKESSTPTPTTPTTSPPSGTSQPSTPTPSSPGTDPVTGAEPVVSGTIPPQQPADTPVSSDQAQANPTPVQVVMDGAEVVKKELVTTITNQDAWWRIPVALTPTGGVFTSGALVVLEIAKALTLLHLW